MKVNEDNLLTLPVEAQYNSEEKEVIFTLRLGFKTEEEPSQKQVWELKKEFAKQLYHIGQQIIE